MNTIYAVPTSSGSGGLSQLFYVSPPANPNTDDWIPSIQAAWDLMKLSKGGRVVIPSQPASVTIHLVTQFVGDPATGDASIAGDLIYEGGQSGQFYSTYAGPVFKFIGLKNCEVGTNIAVTLGAVGGSVYDIMTAATSSRTSTSGVRVKFRAQVDSVLGVTPACGLGIIGSASRNLDDVSTIMLDHPAFSAQYLRVGADDATKLNAIHTGGCWGVLMQGSNTLAIYVDNPEIGDCDVAISTSIVGGSQQGGSSFVIRGGSYSYNNLLLWSDGYFQGEFVDFRAENGAAVALIGSPQAAGQGTARITIRPNQIDGYQASNNNARGWVADGVLVGVHGNQELVIDKLNGIGNVYDATKWLDVRSNLAPGPSLRVTRSLPTGRLTAIAQPVPIWPSILSPEPRIRFACNTAGTGVTGSVSHNNSTAKVSANTAGTFTYRSTFTANTDVTNLRCLFGNGVYLGTGQYSSTNGGANTLTTIGVKSGVLGQNNLTHMFPGNGAGSTVSILPGCWAWTGSTAPGSSVLGQPYLSSGATFKVACAVTTTGRFAYTRQQSSTDEGTDPVMHSSGDSTDQVGSIDAAGSPQSSGGTSTSFAQYTPLAIVGEQVTPIAVVASIGNSIPNGSGPADAIPWTEKAFTGLTNAVFGQRWTIGGSNGTNVGSYDAIGPSLAPYSDYWIDEGFDNDWVGGVTAAQLKAAILGRAKQYSLGGARRYIAVTFTPRTTGSWTSTTPSSTQTAVANESVRQAVNTWLRDTTSTGAVAQSGGAIWMVFDPCTVIETNGSNVLALNGGYWIGNATARTGDGIHPSNAGRDLISAAFPTSSIVRY